MISSYVHITVLCLHYPPRPAILCIPLVLFLTTSSHTLIFMWKEDVTSVLQTPSLLLLSQEAILQIGTTIWAYCDNFPKRKVMACCNCELSRIYDFILRKRLVGSRSTVAHAHYPGAALTTYPQMPSSSWRMTSRGERFNELWGCHCDTHAPFSKNICYSWAIESLWPFNLCVTFLWLFLSYAYSHMIKSLFFWKVWGSK